MGNSPGPVNSPHKGPVTRKIFPFDDVIMNLNTGKLVSGHLNIEMLFYRYRNSHYKDYKNPLHFDVVDRYLRRMGDKTIPDEALPSLESFYPPWVAGIDLPQSRCCGFFVSFNNKHTVIIHIRKKWRLIACVIMVKSWWLFVMQNKACHPLRLKPYKWIQKYQTQLCICRSTTSLCQGFFVVCVYIHINSD